MPGELGEMAGESLTGSGMTREMTGESLAGLVAPRKMSGEPFAGPGARRNLPGEAFAGHFTPRTGYPVYSAVSVAFASAILPRAVILWAPGFQFMEQHGKASRYP